MRARTDAQLVQAIRAGDRHAFEVLHRRYARLLELANRDQAAPATAHDPKLVHDVLLEEVDADAQGLSRVALRECEATE